MIRTLLASLFIIISCNLFGQIRDDSWFEEDTLMHISLNGNVGLVSDQVPLSFSKLFFQGGFITDTQKESALDKLCQLNRFGAQLRYGVEVKMKPEYKTEKGEKTQMFFGYEHQVLLFMSFTDDLFSLIMQGNTFSIGDFMDIGGTYFSNFDFHKVYAGSMRTFGKNNQYVFGVAPFMSFHKPPLIVDITKGSIETKADTSSIQAKISGKMISGLKQEKFVQSIGGGIDLFIGFKEILNDYYVELSLKNFGVYGFEGRRVMVDSDGMVNISGVHLNNLNHPDSAMINYVDSISDEFGFSNDTLINSVMLPYCVSLEVISLNKKNYSLSGRISYYPGQHMLPFVEIFPQYRFNKFFQVGIPVAWGGMGGLFAGAYAGVNLKNLSVKMNVQRCFSFSGFHATGLSGGVMVGFKF